MPVIHFSDNPMIWNNICTIFITMKRYIYLVIFVFLLLGCRAKQETASVHQPPVPNMPPRIPSEPALVKQHLMPPHPDREEEKPRERKKNPPDQYQYLP